MAFTGGAPAVVGEVFTLANQVASELRDDALSRTDAAIAAAGGALPNVVVPIIEGSFPIPAVPSLPTPMSPAEATAYLNQLADQVEQLIRDGLVQFFSDYFPLGDELELAGEWIERVLTQGGAINPTIEAQLWERERARLLADAQRQEDEAVALWAARGYPLPPGAALAAVEQIRRTTQQQIAAASRDVAIKTFETEVQLAQRAVELAINLRTSAIQSASEYIKTLALGPQLGVEYASTLADAQAKLAGAASDFYRAQVQAAEIPVRVATANAEFKMRGEELRVRGSLENLGQRVQAAMAAAQSLGTQAAAALNGLHASASISGSDSTVVE
ncbi:hypothetical protein [Caldimonas sp. KR1-144]|uniref:hypothetical protein n=1 Tax=Caldimonas sp. KR1-144 TaxID=3400911 RepID=UPI003C10B814